MARRLALLACLPLLVAPAAAQAALRVPRGSLGVNAGTELTERPSLLTGEFGQMPKAGVQAVRLTFNWDEAQPTPGPVDFSRTDAIVAAVARRHLGALVTALEAPQWASDDGPSDYPPVLTPRRPRDYADYLVALIHRYGPHGSFWSTHPSVPRDPIRKWQIWNEPNLPYFWRKPKTHLHEGKRCDNQPWVPSYVKLLRASATAVHRADRGAKVVLAGMPNYPWEYLCALYKAGARRDFDEAAIHPYSHYVGPMIPIREHGRRKFVRGGMLEMVRLSRNVMNRHGDRHKPLLLTEVSWPAAKGRVKYDSGINVTPKGEVARIEQALPALARRRKAWGIGAVYWYTWLSDFD
ncbi:MAG TPA: hypothetical protein VGI54_06130, partial [Solirubrobacteraceae bacterium]